MEAPRSIVTFIVRVTDLGAGRLSGTVEQVRTGERHRFQGAEALARIIDGAVEAETRDADQ
jgi:hypothetical protein